MLKVVAEKILRPDRILAMPEQLREQIAKLQALDREREKLIQRQMALATEQINTCCALVEEWKAEMHESLRERLTAAQRRIDQTSELQEISRRRQLPLKQFGEAQVQGFAEAVRTELLAPESRFAKDYLRMLVSETRMSVASATMKGSNVDMAGAIFGWRSGNPNLAMPRHVSNWRPRQESNLHLRLRRSPFYPLNYGGAEPGDFGMGSAGLPSSRQTQIRSSEFSAPDCARSVKRWAMR